MRIPAALLALALISCAPVLSTYVAPSNARNLRTPAPESVSASFDDDNLLAFDANDLPGTTRALSFDCPDGSQVQRVLVSNSIEQMRAAGGAGMLAFGGFMTASSLYLLRDANGASQETPWGIAALEGAVIGGAGLYAVLFGWHPSPSSLVDTHACDGHETPKAPAIPAAPPLP